MVFYLSFFVPFFCNLLSSYSVTCLACQKGQIQPSDNTPSATCTDCPLGKYVEHSKSTQCLYCSPGSEFVAIDTACQDCLNETVQDSSTTIDAKCHVCPSGYTFVQHNEVCATCPTGRYDVAGNIKLANQEDCATCDVGQSSVHWRSPCTHCSVGLHQESNVSQVWGCKHCATGRQYVDVNSSCTDCVAGQYQSETTRFGHSGIQTCQRCQAGKEFTTTKKECDVCKIGKYQSENNADGVSCLTCGKGKDAPSKELPCEGCLSGKYQPFDVSITYTCTFCTGFETGKKNELCEVFNTKRQRCALTVCFVLLFVVGSDCTVYKSRGHGMASNNERSRHHGRCHCYRLQI